jgi:hypothetical protein
LPAFQEGPGQNGYCFLFGFGIAAIESVCVRALDLEVRFRCLSAGLSPPLCFSSIFNQSGMTIALISSCTVMSLSSAIFRSFVYAESPKDCMNLDESVTPHERCRYYLPEPQFHLGSRAPYKAEHPHNTPTNLLRQYDASRYTIQAHGSDTFRRISFCESDGRDHTVRENPC